MPPPTSVTVILPTGVIIAGSSPNLTCNVELSPVVDVAVTVTTVLTGPAGFVTTNTAQPVMGSTTNHTSTAMIDAARNGTYTCQANVNSSPFIIGGEMMSGTANISVGM